LKIYNIYAKLFGNCSLPVAYTCADEFSAITFLSVKNTPQRHRTVQTLASGYVKIKAVNV